LAGIRDGTRWNQNKARKAVIEKAERMAKELNADQVVSEDEAINEIEEAAEKETD
jgi:hypothetical protein